MDSAARIKPNFSSSRIGKIRGDGQMMAEGEQSNNSAQSKMKRKKRKKTAGMEFKSIALVI